MNRKLTRLLDYYEKASIAFGATTCTTEDEEAIAKAFDTMQRAKGRLVAYIDKQAPIIDRGKKG